MTFSLTSDSALRRYDRRVGTAVPEGRVALALLVAVAAAVWPGGRAEAQLTLGFEPVASGLHSPVGVTHAGDGSRRLFILEQAGRILIHDGSRVLPSAFLDVSALVSCCGERSEEHTSELQSRLHLVCRLLLEKKKKSK